MIRKLPWLQKGSALPQRAITHTPAPPKNDDITPNDNPPLPISRTSKRDSIEPRSEDARTPSTSPPPEAPSEVYMIEGIDKDDMYRMVEDEFLTTARTFTGHLHHLEYQRLKAAAKTQNNDRLTSISRPRAVETANHAGRKMNTVAQSRIRSNTSISPAKTKGQDANSDEGLCDGQEHAWVGTALENLMESPRKPSAPLSVKVRTSNAGTRVAASFRTSKTAALSDIGLPTKNRPDSTMARATAEQKANNSDSSEDPDDLDAKSYSYKNENAELLTADSKRHGGSRETRQPVALGRDQGRPGSSSTVESEGDINLATSESNDRYTAKDTTRILKRMKPNRSKTERTKGATNNSLDIIPTFLG